MEKKLLLSVGDLQYHLHQLEKNGLISFHEEGQRKRYFVKSEVEYEDREILSLMRMKTPRRIAIFLLLNPDSSFKMILSEFSFTKGALSFHLKRLLKANIIIKDKIGSEVVYRIADEDRVSRVLITYKSSILDEVLDGFVDIWTNIG
jgi:predicted transcriptional regulator